MKRPKLFRVSGGLAALALALSLNLVAAVQAGGAKPERPFLKTELIFPLEPWHNHASCLVETPRGDLLACWFHGSGERTADDVKIEGARLRKHAKAWSSRFVMADTPGYPDTNCALGVDPRGRLWLFYVAVLANQWESSLLKYRIARHYSADGPPQWETSEVLHVTPDPAQFERAATNWLAEFKTRLATMDASTFRDQPRLERELEEARHKAGDKLYQRLGWIPRAHPFFYQNRRLILPLYSDTYSFSLMAITDDWGQTWRTSSLLIEAGNVQPSIVERQDGSLYTLMRDNGLPPGRLFQSESRDGGETWGPVTKSALLNPGSGAEVIRLRNGHWLLIGNDTEDGRHSLAVTISPDEGRTWPWQRHLEFNPPGPKAGRFHYPAVIQARDGSLHATYSYHLPPDTSVPGGKERKSIKHAHFNEAWVLAGDAAGH